MPPALRCVVVVVVMSSSCSRRCRCHDNGRSCCYGRCRASHRWWDASAALNDCERCSTVNCRLPLSFFPSPFFPLFPIPSNRSPSRRPPSSVVRHSPASAARSRSSPSLRGAGGDLSLSVPLLSLFCCQVVDGFAHRTVERVLSTKKREGRRDRAREEPHISLPLTLLSNLPVSGGTWGGQPVGDVGRRLVVVMSVITTTGFSTSPPLACNDNWCGGKLLTSAESKQQRASSRVGRYDPIDTIGRKSCAEMSRCGSARWWKNGAPFGSVITTRDVGRGKV